MAWCSAWRKAPTEISGGGRSTAYGGSAETLSILTNKEVIAIDQDPLGQQGSRFYNEGPVEIWTKPLSGGAKAVALFNRGESPRKITVDLASVGFNQGAKLRDLWAHQDVQATNGVYTATVPKHSVVLLKISR